MMNKTRKQEIETLAVNVLRDNNIESNPASNLEKILIKENIKLVHIKHWDDSKCGELNLINDKYVIFLNSNHDKEIQNFTIAHELGHYFLNHLDNAESKIICINRDMHKIEHEKDPQEVEANFFAACLLLPINFILEEFDRFMFKENLRQQLYVDNQRCNIMTYKKCIAVLKAHFSVSQTAIRFRLINLGRMKFNVVFENQDDLGVNIDKFINIYLK